MLDGEFGILEFVFGDNLYSYGFDGETHHYLIFGMLDDVFGIWERVFGKKPTIRSTFV